MGVGVSVGVGVWTGDGVLVGVGDTAGDGDGLGEGVAEGVRVAEGDGGIEVETNVGTGVPSRTLAINSLKRQLCKSETPAAAPRPIRKRRRLNLRTRLSSSMGLILTYQWRLSKLVLKRG